MKKIAPTRDEIALLEPFDGIPLERIFVPETLEQFAAAIEELRVAGVVGFDTEAKPVFNKGETSTGPHVVQFALSDKVYLFQLHREVSHPFLIEIFQSEEILKVGFGLQSDNAQIYNKFGVKLNAVLDMSSVFRKQGYPASTGVKTAVAIVFNKNFKKSKRVTTSNWAAKQLTDKQLLYAANDAYAALRVFQESHVDELENCSADGDIGSL